MSNTERMMPQDYSTHWELKQLVKSGLYTDEGDALRSALRALYQAHPQARVQMAVRAYAAGEISLGRAAALLGVSQEEMKDILRETGAEIHLGPATAAEVLTDAEHA
jgi:predicted HTH domain antitoxin